MQIVRVLMIAATCLVLAGCGPKPETKTIEGKWTTLWRLKVGAPPDVVPFKLSPSSLPARITLENPNQSMLITVSPGKGGSFVKRLSAEEGEHEIELKLDGDYTLSAMDTDRPTVVLVQSQNPNKPN